MLTDDAYVIGHSISSLNLSRRGVSIIALRRNNQEIEQPDESTTLLPQDTLILRGKPRKVEHTERYLHKGQN